MLQYGLACAFKPVDKEGLCQRDNDITQLDNGYWLADV